MFQWFREIEVTANGQAIRAFVPFGDGHPDAATAKAWIRKIDFPDAGQFRLAGPPVRTRTVIVIDGLDDDEAAPAPAAADGQAAEAKRRGRPPKLAAVPTPAAEATVADSTTTGIAEAQAEAAPELSPELEREIETAACSGESPAALCRRDGGPLLEDEPFTAAGVPTAEATPAAAPAPAATVAEAIGAAPETGPRVELDGQVLELHDGRAWFWQKFQTATTAERTARKAQEAIDAGGDAMATSLRGIAVMLKPGRRPVEA